MIDRGLIEALNRSIDLIQGGSSIDDCLRRYPQHAVELASLLEAGRLVRQVADADAAFAAQAQGRQRFRFEQALDQYTLRRPALIQRPLLRWVASIALIVALLAGGTGLLAQTSLPGDALYGVKLWTETMRLTLTWDDPTLQAAFAARRIDEARQLIQLGRQAEMTFAGVVDAVTADGLVIDGLAVRITGGDYPPGSRVEVDVLSTGEGTLVARRIRLLQAAPSPTPSPTSSATSSTMPAEMRSSTSEPTPRLTEPIMRGVEAAPTPSADRASGGVGCPEPPERWARYIVQAGDTLSALAVASGATLDAVMSANCLQAGAVIVVGQTLYLPHIPAPTRATGTTEARPAPTQQGDGGGERPTPARRG